uniref:Uncharacterized protein n=1 Tax=Arundo donax TaxID=35708 RepID=A0A0A9VL44_ARUDO
MRGQQHDAGSKPPEQSFTRIRQEWLPNKGERYHVPDFHRGAAPRTPKEKFNKIHSSKRNVIERAFGVWKMKWQILLKMPHYSIETQKIIVAAAMTLHNYIRWHDKGIFILFESTEI